MRAIGGLVIKKGKILIVHDPVQGWLFPGGKIKENETEESCLQREFLEELSITKIKNIKFYKSCLSQSTKHHQPVKVDMYFVNIENPEPLPSNEIKQAIFTSAPEKYPLIQTAKEIIHNLRKEGLL
jgi:8-oxo-dGTP pyrophosphatase MutT (NUDIX family)